MSGFEVDAEELRAAARALRAFASYPPARSGTVCEAEVQQIRNPQAATMISSLIEKGYDHLVDLVTVILALGDGLERVAADFGLADVWNSR